VPGFLLVVFGQASTVKDPHSELDFYVLRMIKFNTTSPTAPYRDKSRALSIDANVDT